VLPDQAILTLSQGLAVVGYSPSAKARLTMLQPGPPPHQGVPGEVLNVAAQLLACGAGVDRQAPEARVCIGSGRWLRATRMAPLSAGSTSPLAVTIHGCSPAARLDMFARCFGLTRPQGELLDLAAAGARTAAIAAAQAVSPYTVRDQIKQISQAGAVHSRASLLALAMGTAPRLS
jgi:DNA-binding CsgD family transcriptional regulator